MYASIHPVISGYSCALSPFRRQTNMQAYAGSSKRQLWITFHGVSGRIDMLSFKCRSKRFISFSNLNNRSFESHDCRAKALWKRQIPVVVHTSEVVHIPWNSNYVCEENKTYCTECIFLLTIFALNAIYYCTHNSKQCFHLKHNINSFWYFIACILQVNELLY